MQEHPETSVRAQGFREQCPFGNWIGSVSGNLILNLRVLMGNNIEPLWTIEGWDNSQVFAAVKKQRDLLWSLDKSTDFSKAPQVMGYMQATLSRLGAQNDLGSWTLLKPQDFDFLLNDE